MALTRAPRGANSRLVAGVLAASVSLAISLVAAEFVFRGYRRVEYQKALAAFDDAMYQVLPPGRYYTCAANLALQVTVPQDAGPLPVVYTTDGEGWRVQPPVAVTPATRRVMCLGDSYTFGLAVADDQTYPWHLQHILAARGLDAVVQNRGVPGYNTVQEYHTLVERFAVDAPHVVVLGYVMNDAEPIMTVPFPPDLEFKQCRSWLLEAARPGINVVARWLVSDQPLCTSRAVDSLLDYRPGFAYRHFKWRESRAALAAMHAFLRARGVPLLVFVQPAFTERFDDTYMFFLLHERVQEWGAADGYPTFDLLPLFWGENHRDLYVQGDGHPGGVAQRRMAVAMADEIQRVLR